MKKKTEKKRNQSVEERERGLWGGSLDSGLPCVPTPSPIPGAAISYTASLVGGRAAVGHATTGTPWTSISREHSLLWSQDHKTAALRWVLAEFGGQGTRVCLWSKQERGLLDFLRYHPPVLSQGQEDPSGNGLQAQHRVMAEPREWPAGRWGRTRE